MSQAVLRLRDLTVTVPEAGREKILVDGVNLDIPSESIVALVGGSGSGKTTTGLAVLRLLPLALTLRKGVVFYKSRDLLQAGEAHMRRVRGKEIGMVFQEPLSAFNPVFSIGYQIEEVLRYHMDWGRSQRQERVEELLDIVGLPDPRAMRHKYPHQLSGGMRQRAMIAQAIAADPKLIIADEPTSNLDVTLQARIMDLFRKLKKDLGLSVLLITHDLGVVAHLADEVAVMREGRIVERGTTRQILDNPAHEYTRVLVDAGK